MSDSRLKLNQPSLSIHVVLVQSLYSRNIGSVSRAMANMGAQKLILIDPKCEINLEARQGAAGAQTHLLEATTYKSWDEFFASEREGIRIAFCARNKNESDDLEVGARINWLMNEGHLTFKEPLYLIFGPEDHGLTNADIEFANFICSLPTMGPFKSLNLSHAVLLALYIVKSSLQAPKTLSQKGAEMVVQNESIDSGAYQFPTEAIQTWLHALGFEFGGRRTDVYKVIKRILLKNIATAKELRILEAVIFQTIRKLQAKDPSETL